MVSSHWNCCRQKMFRLGHHWFLENLKALEMEEHPQRQLQQIELMILGWAFLLTPDCLRFQGVHQITIALSWMTVLHHLLLDQQKLEKLMYWVQRTFQRMIVVRVQTRADLQCCQLEEFVADQKHQKMPNHHRSLMEHFCLAQEQVLELLH